MTNYLFKRGGRYSYRRRFPLAVSELLGRVEFVRALGTADPVMAQRLSRKVSVAFDDICTSALLSLASSSGAPLPEHSGDTPLSTNAELAKRVLDGLPGIVTKITEDILAEQVRNPNWLATVDWQRRALNAHIAGIMPREVARTPVEARTALTALEAAVRGELVERIATTAPMEVPTESASLSVEKRVPVLTQAGLNAALTEYSIGKSHRRKAMVHRHTVRMLKLPTNQEDAVSSISAWCTDELSKLKKPSSVWTEASSVIALLKYVPGWHQFSVPKVGALRKLKGAGRANAEARASMSVSHLHGVLRELPKHLPRGGGYWHATLLLCALYGLRPGELLQSGPESIQEHMDVFDRKRLVFRVGLANAKNSSSKRDIPISDELLPVLNLALSKGSCPSETARTRVDRMNRLVSKSHGVKDTGITLYSIRHLFADIARSCNYSDEQFGPLMGHTSKSTITAVYGGKAPLDFNAELLDAIRLKLFPEGLAEFLPVELRA